MVFQILWIFISWRDFEWSQLFLHATGSMYLENVYDLYDFLVLQMMGSGKWRRISSYVFEIG